MRMRAEKSGMAITTEIGRSAKGGVAWVSTIAFKGEVLGRKDWDGPEDALLGHARLASLYIDELSSGKSQSPRDEEPQA